MSVRGVDVSHYQGRTDWRGLADAECAFTFIKATEGRTYTDPEFRRNWSGAARAGIRRGAYHLGHPRNDPHGDADHFLSVVGPGRGDLLVLDYEVDDGEPPDHCARWAASWLKRVKAWGGITPIVYTFPNFAHTGHCDGLGGWPLWIASYRSTPDVPAPWKTWVFWQYTSTGRLGPHRGDLDYFNGSLAELRRLPGRLAGHQEDDMPEYVSLGANTATELPSNAWVTLRFDVEYADSKRQHSDRGAFPSMLTGPAPFTATVDLRIKGLAKGTECQARFVETDPDQDHKIVKLYAPVEFTGTNGDTFATLNQAAGHCDSGNHLYAQVIQYGDASATLTNAHAKVHFWR